METLPLIKRLDSCPSDCGCERPLDGLHNFRAAIYMYSYKETVAANKRNNTEARNVTYFQDFGLMVHVYGKFDGILCEATEAAGRHDVYAALCHRLSTHSDTGNTPRGQESEGATMVSTPKGHDFSSERQKNAEILL
jgi:hypothetical protein